MFPSEKSQEIKILRRVGLRSIGSKVSARICVNHLNAKYRITPDRMMMPSKIRLAALFTEAPT